MISNKKFGLIVLFVVLLLIALVVINNPIEYNHIIIEEKYGEETQLSFKDINRFKGIDFEELKDLNPEQYDIKVQENVKTLLSFFESYKSKKEKNVKKIFYIEQILDLTKFKNYDYRSITFESVEGAQIKIEPTESQDFLILLSLEKYGKKYSLRLILPADNFSQRWLKNIAKITLEKKL